jgi:PIN domain nuclease of toxin-antitoxin system
VGRPVVVLDASVVIGFGDANDAHHEAAVAALAANCDHDLLIPASAYAETLVRPYEHSEKAAAKAERAIAELPIQVVPIDADIARQAARLRARRRSLTLGDAPVLGTGEELPARVLTTDGEWPKVSRRAKVI